MLDYRMLQVQRQTPVAWITETTLQPRKARGPKLLHVVWLPFGTLVPSPRAFASNSS